MHSCLVVAPSEVRQLALMAFVGAYPVVAALVLLVVLPSSQVAVA